MAREPLRQEQVVRRLVHGRYRGVSRRMKGVQPIEPGPSLPRRPRMLDPTLRDAAAGLVGEEGGVGRQVLAASPLPRPVPPHLRDEPIRQEHVGSPAALRNLLPDAHSDPRRPVRGEHVAHVEANDLREAEASAEGDGDDHVVAEVRLGDTEDEGLFVGGEGRRR